MFEIIRVVFAYESAFILIYCAWERSVSGHKAPDLSIDRFAPGNASNIHIVVQYGPRLFVSVDNRIYIMNESFHVLLMIVDNVNETNVNRCVKMNGLSTDRCTNHVLFIHVFNDSEFFTCGTNALRPKCTYWRWNPKRSEFEPKRVIDDDTIFLIADEPTNNKPIVSFDSTTNIVVTALRNSRKFHDAIIKVKLHPELKAWRTERYMDSLNDPHFAQIYDDKNETYILMHEIDENFKRRSSRIARVCNNDNGRQNNPYILALFAKVSLNCSIWNDQAAFQFDIVELATLPLNVEYDQTTGNRSVDLVYAVFSTPNHVFKISAICAFAIEDIRQAFHNNASFIDSKGQVTPPSPWILNCSQNTLHMDRKSELFLKTHKLLANFVPAFFGNCPIFTIQHRNSNIGRFSSIVVDPQVISVNGDRRDVIFLSTDNGKIYKIVHAAQTFHSKSSEKCTENGFSKIAEIIQLASNLDITRMLIFRQSIGAGGEGNDRLIIAAKTTLLSIALSSCKMKAKTCRQCLELEDPYCHWNSHYGACRWKRNLQWDSNTTQEWNCSSDSTSLVQSLSFSAMNQTTKSTTTTTSTSPLLPSITAFSRANNCWTSTASKFFKSYATKNQKPNLRIVHDAPDKKVTATRKTRKATMVKKRRKHTVRFGNDWSNLDPYNMTEPDSQEAPPTNQSHFAQHGSIGEKFSSCTCHWMRWLLLILTIFLLL